MSRGRGQALWARTEAVEIARSEPAEAENTQDGPEALVEITRRLLHVATSILVLYVSSPVLIPLTLACLIHDGILADLDGLFQYLSQPPQGRHRHIGGVPTDRDWDQAGRTASVVASTLCHVPLR